MSNQPSRYFYTMDTPVGAPPRRVVSLVPSVTESLFDLNLGDRLVGVTDYCVRPAAQTVWLAKVGGTKDPDIARIAALRPDLVIVNQEENRREDAEALAAAGLALWVTHPRTVADALNLLWNMMYVFDETAMVPRVQVIERTLDWVQGASRALARRARVFVPVWWEPLMSFNADTYIHDLLRVCGGDNVFASSAGRYGQVALADVVAAQPDVILLPSEPFAFGAAQMAQFAALDVPAAHSDSIYLVDGSLLTWHGTRLAYALDALPALLNPVAEL